MYTDTYPVEGSWDSDTFSAQYHFPYQELEPAQELERAPALEAKLLRNMAKQAIGTTIEFIDVDSEPMDTPESLLMGRRRLAVVSTRIFVPIEINEFYDKLARAQKLRMPAFSLVEFATAKFKPNHIACVKSITGAYAPAMILGHGKQRPAA